MNKYSNATEYSLRDVKTNKAFSEETLCFRALVVRDGEAVAHASNDGHGGCHHVVAIEPFRLAELSAAAYMLPPYTYSDGTTLERGLDGLIDVLLAEHEAREHARRYFTFIPAGGSIERGFSYLKVGQRKVRADDHPVIGAFLTDNSDVVVVEAR